MGRELQCKIHSFGILVLLGFVGFCTRAVTKSMIATGLPFLYLTLTKFAMNQLQLSHPKMYHHH